MVRLPTMKVTRAEVDAEAVALLRFAGFPPTPYFQMAFDELLALGYFTKAEDGMYERAESVEMSPEFVQQWMGELLEKNDDKLD